MRIILDTNILMADWLQKGMAWRIFLKGVIKIPAKIYIPQVVVDELYRNYSRQLFEYINDLNNLQRKIENLSSNSLSKIDPLILINDYKAHLSKLIADSDITVLEYPKVDLKEAIKRELEGKKPFKSSGEGYRDYVIWLTIKDQINNYEQEDIVFISNNRKDFGIPPNIDVDLAKEIQFKPPRLYYFPSISEFNEKFINPRLEEVKILEDNLGSLFENGFDIFEWVKDNLKDIIWNYDIGTSIIDTEGFGRITLLSINRIIKIDDLSLNKIDDDYEVKFHISADVTFSIDISWDDFQNSKKVRELIDDNGEPFAYTWWNEKRIISFNFLLYITPKGEVIDQELGYIDL